MKKIFLTVFLSLTLIAPGCSNKQQNTQNTPPQVTTENKPKSTTQVLTENKPKSTTQITTEDKTKSMQKKVFTLAELKKYNGQNGNPAYVAIDGVVYDVTSVEKWKNGKHQGVSAGNDLSKAIASAPHGKSVLTKLPVIGSLK